MKLVVCGKGGSGKSTLTSLLAQEYARKNNRVLVVDTDESNSGLHRLLGTEAPQDLMGFFGGRPGMSERIKAVAPDYTKVVLIDKPWNLDMIPEGYVTKKGNISLVSIGKIHHSGEGCACPMGMLSRQFLKSLELAGNDVVITDTEAGIEHFGRGIDEEVDCILMVVDPSFESMSLAEKISDMTTGSKKPLYYILNRVTTEISAQIHQKIKNPENIIAEFPEDPEVLSMGLSGSPITREYPVVSELVQRLEQ